MKMKISKICEKIFITLSILFFIWVFISWVDVLNHNSPSDSSSPAEWNTFVVLTNILK